MASTIYPDYPPELSDARRQYLLTNLKDWSIASGLAVRPGPSYVPQEQDPGLALATTAPVTLFPSLFPKSCFEHGVKIQTAYNKLYSAIAQDEAWLKPIIEEYVPYISFFVLCLIVFILSASDVFLPCVHFLSQRTLKKNLILIFILQDLGSSSLYYASDMLCSGY
jgi:hypothetical protein